MKQKIVRVQESVSTSLEKQIEEQINLFNKKSYEVQQIDYFSMTAENDWNPYAFILFKEIEK